VLQNLAIYSTYFLKQEVSRFGVILRLIFRREKSNILPRFPLQDENFILHHTIEGRTAKQEEMANIRSYVDIHISVHEWGNSIPFSPPPFLEI
jgi:hypothetical protein